MIATSQIVLPHNLEKKESELITPEKELNRKLLPYLLITFGTFVSKLVLTVKKDEQNKMK